MPVKSKKLKSGKVRNTTPGGVKGKAMTPENAKKQKRLLNAIDHGFVIDKNKKKRRRRKKK